MGVHLAMFSRHALLISMLLHYCESNPLVETAFGRFKAVLALQFQLWHAAAGFFLVMMQNDPLCGCASAQHVEPDSRDCAQSTAQRQQQQPQAASSAESAPSFQQASASTPARESWRSTQGLGICVLAAFFAFQGASSLVL